MCDTPKAIGLYRKVLIEDLTMYLRREMSVSPRCVWHTYSKKVYFWERQMEIVRNDHHRWHNDELVSLTSVLDLSVTLICV